MTTLTVQIGANLYTTKCKTSVEAFYKPYSNAECLYIDENFDVGATLNDKLHIIELDYIGPDEGQSDLEVLYGVQEFFNSQFGDVLADADTWGMETLE